MTLSVLCVTNGKPYAGKFIEQMYKDAQDIGATMVLGLDGDKAQSAGYPCDRSINLQAVNLQEDVLDKAVNFCDTHWIIRLDDDERMSPRLVRWLKEGMYIKARLPLYAFPRVYMWGDEKHIITNDNMWPDLQTRLGLKEYMYGYTYVHAGNPRGTGFIAPYAIEHHNLLVKSREEREAISRHYESLRPGAGTLPQYARYNLPELFYDVIEVKEYGDGDYSI